MNLLSGDAPPKNKRELPTGIEAYCVSSQHAGMFEFLPILICKLSAF
jgi:hypothetical protein